MANKEKDTKKKKTGFGAALLLLSILVLLIIFLVEKDKLLTNLKETRFFDRVFGSTPEFVENHTSDKPNTDKIPLSEDGTVTINVQTEKPSSSKTDKSKKAADSVNKNIEANSASASGISKENSSAAKNSSADSTATASNSDLKETAKNEQKNTEASQDKQKTETIKVTYTELQLYFVEIDSEGSVNRKLVKRSIPKNDSPLTAAIELLLKGPDTTLSAEKNCMTLIPEGTKLLSAKVKDGVAYLNFNEDFEINGYGVEGYNAQLMQIVYTATTFSTVNSVQFLIEGEKKEYLGSEGQWIGSPLSRNSF